MCSLYAIGSFAALALIKVGKNNTAKILVIVNAAISVTFTFHTFTINHSVLTIFFPIFLAHLYFFNFEKERTALLISLSLTSIVLLAAFAIPRFLFLKVVLTPEVTQQMNSIHLIVSMVITGFVLVVIAQNKTRTNKALEQKTRVLEQTLSELTETQDQLIQNEKMTTLGMLSAGINHEINNPLNFVVGGVENLRHLNKKLNNQEIEPFISALEEGVDRIKSIVGSLNHFNYRSDSKNTRCNLNLILNNCLNILNYELRDDIKVEKNYAERPFVNGKSGQLHQVFLNIIVNSVHALEGKGKISISTVMYKDKVVTKISDSGPGIPDEIKDKIFEPFFTTKEPGKGTGLGLSIIRRIVLQHNGSIEIDTQQGMGTTFCVALPTN